MAVGNKEEAVGGVADGRMQSGSIWKGSDKCVIGDGGGGKGVGERCVLQGGRSGVGWSGGCGAARVKEVMVAAVAS